MRLTTRDDPPDNFRSYQIEGIRGTEAALARFFVRAKSVNEVRRVLWRAPGGARVLGRYNRDTIECEHTMDEHSLRRHWPIIVSRLEKAGLTVVDRPGRSPELVSDVE